MSTKEKLLTSNTPTKFDVNKVRKPWSIVSNGKSLSRNTIYIGDTIPEFLLEDSTKQIFTLQRPNNSIVDDSIRQKIKKTVVTELISLGYKLKPRSSYLRSSVTRIDNTSVRIKRIIGKGWAIIIDKRKSINIDKDTTKILEYLKLNNLDVDDYNICPTYCIIKNTIKKE